MSKKIVFAIGLVLVRLVYLGLPDLFPEEAYYWNCAMHPAFGYLDHPPMVAWMIRLGTALFGHTEFGVRIFALVSSLTAAFFMYRLTILLYDRTAARTSILVMQVLPIFFMAGFMMTPDAPLIACWSASLYFLALIFFAGNSIAWIGFGIALGLGMLSKYTIALLLPSLCLFMILDPQSRVWFRRVIPYFAGMISAVVFSPVIVWNYRHAWASFAFQTTQRISAHREFSLHLLLASILLLLTPVGMILAARLLSAGKRPVAGGGMLNTVGRRIAFERIFTMVPLSVFVLFSLTHKVKLNWTGPIWLALVPAIAACLAMLPVASLLRRAWLVTVGGVAVIYVGLLQYLTTGIPGLGYSKFIALAPVGWSELGRELDSRKAILKKSTRTAVWIVGMDKNFIASEAAFYQKDQPAAVRETTGGHLFGHDSLMYKFWSPSIEQKGATLLLVALNKSDLEGRAIRMHSTPVGPVEESWLVRNGKKICPYYVQVVSDYRGP